MADEVPAISFCVLRNALDKPAVQDLLESASRCYAAAAKEEPWGASDLRMRSLSTGGRFLPTASSFSIDAVLQADEIRTLLARVGAAVRNEVSRWLPGPLVVDVDQAWFRRQYPANQAPRFHSPHAWHQDGALGYDFSADPECDAVSSGMLEIVTVWLALTTCGHEAPGLELLNPVEGRLLAPRELDDSIIRQRFAAGAFHRPLLNAGDALLFPGGTLHRTHVTAEMSKIRTSVELRFFPADPLPSRLLGDRFVALAG